MWPRGPGLVYLAPGLYKGYNAGWASLHFSSPHKKDEPSHWGSLELLMLILILLGLRGCYKHH